MKFHNGCWLLKEGFAGFSPQEIYEVKKTENALILCAPARKITKKGDTLDGVNLTIRITAPMAETFRVQIIHHKGIRKKEPEFALNLDKARPIEAEEDGKLLRVRDGRMCLVVNKADGSMALWREEKLLTRWDGKDMAYIRGDFTGLAYDVREEKKAWMSQNLGLSVGS